ncbi:putative DNA modification/repair radical SAM protein [Corallococcus sp. AS-1-6]|uniref:putative DNA modification/repair radical SAM protein n=1 Tax=Corallococcus sp. AS-1-6 TaxID=2874599 RepID=UPI001CBD3C48|nr:putative DNA modification/repair radical SAM protein [Corallococcus sp. AS-1-6]
MDVRKKLEILADAAKYDASCSSSGGKRKAGKDGLGSVEGMGICHSYTPDGRCVSLLKILLTHFCIYDCQYCINRISSDTARARFTPAEVVRLTLDFYKRNYIEGLFLSSGVIKSPDYTMEQLIEVARTRREVHGFQGYIHLKAVPGASQELIDAAGRYADRLSANIEVPTDGDLKKLAPEKSFAVTGGTMKEISAPVEQSRAERQEIPKAPKFAPAGQSGATPSPDAAILDTASRLYTRFSTGRAYRARKRPRATRWRRCGGHLPPLGAPAHARRAGAGPGANPLRGGPAPGGGHTARARLKARTAAQRVEHEYLLWQIIQISTHWPPT